MQHPANIRRIVLVVLDGVRSDSVALFPLPHFKALAQRGARTFAGRTVLPSVTAAAMTSLFTGVAPETHGIMNDRFGLPRAGLLPLPVLLAEHGVPVHAYLHNIARAYRGLAARVGSRLNATITFAGEDAAEIAATAATMLDRRLPGLYFLHWPDADRAGHASGWTSAHYARAARNLDQLLGALVERTGVLDDPSTLLIAMADHGGGGVDPRDHDSRHPLDTTIPIVLAGGQILPGELPAGTRLLDVAATIPWALGIDTPTAYHGVPLASAFSAPREEALAGAAA